MWRVLTLTLVSLALPVGADARAASCAQRTQANVRAYVAAYNRGDTRRLDRLFAPATDFQWYSSPAPGLRLREASKDRSTLAAYFTGRHRTGDRLRLKRFRFNGSNGAVGNFEMTLRRRAPGFRAGRWFTVSGKGATLCRSGRIIVVSLGSPE
jgi:hypothetical protein